MFSDNNLTNLCETVSTNIESIEINAENIHHKGLITLAKMSSRQDTYTSSSPNRKSFPIPNTLPRSAATCSNIANSPKQATFKANVKSRVLSTVMIHYATLSNDTLDVFANEFKSVRELTLTCIKPEKQADKISRLVMPRGVGITTNLHISLKKIELSCLDGYHDKDLCLIPKYCTGISDFDHRTAVDRVFV